MELVPLKPSLWTENLPVQTTINPKLAAEIGLNESLVLLQIAFWINHSNNLRDNEWWTYQSLEDMKEKAFPYWSIATISRVINNLVSSNLLRKSDAYNKRKNDRTQWFSLNLEGLSNLKSIKVILQNEKTISQNAKSTLQNETTLPEYTPEKNTEQKETPISPEPSYQGNTDLELEEMKKAVKRICRQYDKDQVQAIAKSLLCRFKGKDAERNLRRPISIAELEQWGLDMDKRLDYKTGKPLTRPRNQSSVLNNVSGWMDELDGKLQAGTPSKSVIQYANNTSTLAQAELSEDERAAALATFKAGRLQKASGE